MKREIIEARPNLSARLAERAFDVIEGSFDLPYWQDQAFYSFSMAQIEEIEAATNELHQMCVQAAHHVIQEGRLGEFGIPEYAHNYIRTTLERGDPVVYGRFDLSYDGTSPPKMLEYNADTPTSLYEASVLQWDWLNDRMAQNPVRVSPESDQFNGIHESLVDVWKAVAYRATSIDTMHFTCFLDSLEDTITTAYIQETARQAGMNTHIFDINHMGRTATDFVDDNAKIVKGIFKLYPWEFMLNDDYGRFVVEDRTGFIEPAWKSILSNKNLLPVLWELFPGHPNLLPAFRDAASFDGKPYVKKAVLGREGSSVSIIDGGTVITSDNMYDQSGFVYQAYAPLPNFNGFYPVIGSWVIGDEAKGMGIREDNSPITRNTSRFVPHVITPPAVT
jgi:glutathionylspermidine synthase